MPHKRMTCLVHVQLSCLRIGITSDAHLSGFPFSYTSIIVRALLSQKLIWLQRHNDEGLGKFRFSRR